ncbi:unnamed protein product [Mytilus coruscus]|uniref:DUF6589 domain-containing protein n=1 Tax=Mytilus coruscus TaxID=42192 RepID=A0A6J8CWF5_MYTCO|nr:unnamed protein product [Mytilus coruscus]
MLNLKSNADYDYPSMLRTCSQTDLSEQDIFMGIIQEMKTRCPHLLEILVSVCVKDETKVNLRQITSVAVAYSCLMFARNNKNSDIQRCITLLAVKGDANDEVRLKDIDAEMFVLNESETMKLNDVQKVLIGRLLCDRDEFKWLKNKLPQHIPHRRSPFIPSYENETARRAFINTKGGNGKNKEADLVQEHAIRNQKDLIRGLGANKTENGSRRASSSADIIHRIGDNIDHLLNIPKLTTSHAKKTSSKDLEIAINILRKVQPFNYVKGRQFESFKTIAKNPKLVVQKKDLVHAIHKKIQRLFLNS